MFGIKKLTKAVYALTVEARRLVEALNRLADMMEEPILPPNPVGVFRARLIKEDGNMLVYEYDLPQLPDPGNPGDVTHGRVILKYGTDVQPEIRTDIGQQVLIGVRIPQGTVVNGDFAFVDDQGNPSADPVELVEFTASDTIPPPDPVGGFGARLVAEEPDQPA